MMPGQVKVERLTDVNTVLCLDAGGGVPVQSAALRLQRPLPGGREHAASHQQGKSQQPLRLRHGHQAQGTGQSEPSESRRFIAPIALSRMSNRK